MAQWIADGKVLRDARVARNETLGEVAEQLGISSSELSAIERGLRPEKI